MKRSLTATLALALVAGCGQVTPGLNDSFNSEAGSSIDSGSFGNASMNNMLVQSGHQSYMVTLQRRFEEDVPSMVNFAFNSATLDADAQGILMRQADWIKQFPEVRFKVFGHTDLVGSTGYNQRLGMARARAAVNFLVAQGISRSRLEAVVSRGESQPLVVTEGRERKNRRTVTEVTGFVENHPTVLNGKYGEVIFREYVLSAQPATDVTQATSDGSGGE